jgi:hypothetical protein
LVNESKAFSGLIGAFFLLWAAILAVLVLWINWAFVSTIDGDAMHLAFHFRVCSTIGPHGIPFYFMENQEKREMENKKGELTKRKDLKLVSFWEFNT